MRNLLFRTIALLVATATIASAQLVTFRAEIDSIQLQSGASVDRANLSSLNMNALGFFVPSASYASFVGSDVWTGVSAQISPAQFQSITTYLEGQPGYASAAAITPTPGVAPDFFGVFNGTLNAGGAGFHPVFIIHDSPNGPLALGDALNFGIVTSTFSTLSLGTTEVSFSTTVNTWDTFLVGQPGSITLTSIPEPTTYALILSVVGLAVVMRRRMRR